MIRQQGQVKVDFKVIFNPRIIGQDSYVVWCQGSLDGGAHISKCDYVHIIRWPTFEKFDVLHEAAI
ncbi:hypothetical protein D3C77_759870 [compost metagenome]